MSTTTRACRCGQPLIVASVVTALSPDGALLTLCAECDRPRCPRCRNAYGAFFAGPREACEHCGYR